MSKMLARTVVVLVLILLEQENSFTEGGVQS